VSHIDHVQTLMEELGPASADIAIAGVFQTGEADWGVAFDDEVVIALELDDESGRLYLTSDLGAPEDGRRAEICEVLLTYNGLIRQTGGVTAALTEPEGGLRLLLRLDAGSLTLEVLQTVLANFAEKTRVWRDYVATGDAPPPVEDPSTYLRV
jgi:hypothetical protein